jgi:hypothetical protein
LGDLLPWRLGARQIITGNRQAELSSEFVDCRRLFVSWRIDSEEEQLRGLFPVVHPVPCFGQPKNHIASITKGLKLTAVVEHERRH